MDGVAFAGGTAEHQTLVIGSGNFIPGFEEQMVGMTIGEERDLHVTFPEQYHAEDLKGKDAVFHVKLHAITREELPDVDDEFAAEVSDFDTLAEYRADLEKKMQEAADAQAEEAARQTLVDSVVRAAECDVPRSHGGGKAGRHDAADGLAHAAAGFQHGAVPQADRPDRAADARHVPLRGPSTTSRPSW